MHLTNCSKLEKNSDQTPAYKIIQLYIKLIIKMSAPKIVKILSLEKRKSFQQDKLSPLLQDKSSIETVIMTQHNTTTSSQSVLVSQIKKLSKDNDRLWKLLTQNTDNHSECTKAQKKLKQNLQCVQKQASLIKEMYDVQKSNHQQSKLFYQKREIQWQSIVSELKKVIEDYETTSELDVCRASQIFNQSTQLRSPPKFLKKNQKLLQKQKEISQYYNHELYAKQKQSHKADRYQNQKESKPKQQQEKNNFAQSQIKESQIQYNKNSEIRQSFLSINSKKHRQKWFKAPTVLQSSSSSKKLFQNLYKKQMSNMEDKKNSVNPEIRYDFLNNQDLFDYAGNYQLIRQIVRRTYMKFRQQGEKALDIMNNQHLQKLKTANSSTKQRLNKTIRKIFILNNQTQLEEIIQYIQERVHRKHKLIKGEFIYQFLQQKFLQCEQLIESSNSALDRLDKQASNVINGASMNSRFRLFQQKKRQIRSLQKFQSSKNSFRESKPINNLREHDQNSQISSKSSNLQLNINSNIKGDKKLLYYHQNNHLNSNELEEDSIKKNNERQRDNSRKNIYTQKNISRKQFLQPQRCLTQKKMEASRQSSKMQNLSSLIGGTKLTNQYQIIYRSNQKQCKPVSGYNKTADTTIKS